MADVPPNQTIYVQNINEKVKKEELKRALHAVFSQFGKILDVVCLRTQRLRGQAWVVFADVPSATSALRLMQGFPFFDRPMRITFAKTKSDAAAKAEGVFVPRDKIIEAKRKAEERERQAKARKEREKEKAAAAAAAGPAAPAATASMPPARAEPPAPPHKILFVQNLPEATTSMMLSMLFQQFPGYKEVRMVDARPGIAFVEFESDMTASVASSGLQGFKITPTNSMVITFARR